MPVSWRWGAWCRVWTVRVGLSRIRADSFPCFGLLRLSSSTIPRCLCWVLGSLQACKGPASLSDSLSAGVMASWQYALSNAYSCFGTGLLYHCFGCDCSGMVRADVPGQYRGGRPSCPIHAGYGCIPDWGWEQSGGESVPAVAGVVYRFWRDAVQAPGLALRWRRSVGRARAGARPAPTGN